MDVIIGFLIGVFLGVTWSFSYVSEDDFAKGQEVCKVNSGLVAYVSETVGSPHVTCKNGAKFQLKESK